MTPFAQQDSLSRFVAAQAGVYETAWAELAGGRKRSHWMWYIFPQLAGLGFSPTAQYYALADLAEARAFLAHPELGPRLVRISALLLSLGSSDATAVFGPPDDLKLRSSMTLFALAAPQEQVFQQVLDKFFYGKRDPLTLKLLGLGSPLKNAVRPKSP